MFDYHRLDDVHMSAIDREHAKAHMRSAELLIDFVFAAAAATRQFSTAVAQRLTALTLWSQALRREAAQ